MSEAIDARGSSYARAGIADSWIVSVGDRLLEVYRNPVPPPGAPHGWGWAHGHVGHLEPQASVSSLAAPTTSIEVADLLP